MTGTSNKRFTPAMVMPLLKQAAIDGGAADMVVVFDTAKNFADLMDKKNSSDFMRNVKDFVAAGGTAILLCHVNKRKEGF